MRRVGRTLRVRVGNRCRAHQIETVHRGRGSGEPGAVLQEDVSGCGLTVDDWSEAWPLVARVEALAWVAFRWAAASAGRARVPAGPVGPGERSGPACPTST